MLIHQKLVKCAVKSLMIALFLITIGGQALADKSGFVGSEGPNNEVQLSIDQNSRDLMASALGEAKGSVRAVVYKFDDPKMMLILQEALDRGLGLRVLCDEKQSNKHGSLFSKLAKSGAEVRIWPKKQGKLHAKFVICDAARVLSGSWNWTRSAGDKNLELLLDINEKSMVNRFEELFSQLWEKGHPLDK